MIKMEMNYAKVSSLMMTSTPIKITKFLLQCYKSDKKPSLKT